MQYKSFVINLKQSTIERSHKQKSCFIYFHLKFLFDTFEQNDTGEIGKKTIGKLFHVDASQILLGISEKKSFSQEVSCYDLLS